MKITYTITTFLIVYIFTFQYTEANPPLEYNDANVLLDKMNATVLEKQNILFELE